MKYEKNIIRKMDYFFGDYPKKLFLKLIKKQNDYLKN